MKAIFTLVFTLVIALSSFGQKQPAQAKVTPMAKGVVLLTSINPGMNEMKGESRQVARLYRRSNARVTKALSFSTARNRPQFA